MKTKYLISLAVAFGFLSVGTTGILMYLGIKGSLTIVHVTFGLIFVAVSVFHLLNNWNSIMHYTRDKQKSNIRKEFILVIVILLPLLAGASMGLRPLSAFVHAGEKLGEGEREGGEHGNFRNASFTDVSTNENVQGTALNFIIQKGEGVTVPIIAIWTADSAGKFADNLFVPSKVNVWQGDGEDIRRAMFEGKVKQSDLTPEMLKEWRTASNGARPNVEGATPLEDFFLKTITSAGPRFKVMLEVRNGGTSELYSAEVDVSRSNIYKLEARDGKLLKRAIIEVVN